MGKYDSILRLPHKQSVKRPHMSLHDRAAQFAPFAALTGYNEEVSETARLTDRKIQLSDERLDELNRTLIYLRSRIADRPRIRITFFIPDGKKEGGSYDEVTGIVKRIDEYNRRIIMEDDTRILLDDITDLTLCP